MQEVRAYTGSSPLVSLLVVTWTGSRLLHKHVTGATVAEERVCVGACMERRRLRREKRGRFDGGRIESPRV